jgi:hypothetical protein
MEKLNPVFENNYKGYLEALTGLDLSIRCSILDISFDEDRKTVEIPFFGNIYRVARDNVVNADGKRPDYGICVILLKYLLMCPRQIPIEDDWISYRDFKDSGLSLDVSFSDHARRAITDQYSGQKGALENATVALGGTLLESDYPYDVAAMFRVLPRVPVLLLFNDVDDEFPAKTSILFERRAERFLDVECLAMVGGYLFDKLKRTGKLIMEKNIR